MFEIFTRKGMSLGRRGLVLAAEGGHLECLKYAHEKGCPWDERLVLMLPQEVTSSV